MNNSIKISFDYYNENISIYVAKSYLKDINMTIKEVNKLGLKQLITHPTHPLRWYLHNNIGPAFIYSSNNKVLHKEYWKNGKRRY